jgi:hypothetical protein
MRISGFDGTAESRLTDDQFYFRMSHYRLQLSRCKTPVEWNEGGTDSRTRKEKCNCLEAIPCYDADTIPFADAFREKQ